MTGAFALSARQNDGKPLHGRSCQPELKLCNAAVVFRRDDGVDVMVRRAEDPTGKTVSRDVCEFNKFGDVRICVNWDTGVSIREMKNDHGDWIKVGDE